MEWLQASVLIGIFLVWAAAVLAVLAILSIGRDSDEAGDEAPMPRVQYRDSRLAFEIGTKPMLGAGK